MVLVDQHRRQRRALPQGIVRRGLRKAFVCCDRRLGELLRSQQRSGNIPRPQLRIGLLAAGVGLKNVRNLQARDEKSASKYTNPDSDPRGPWRLGPIFAAEEGRGIDVSSQNPFGAHYQAPKGQPLANGRAGVLETRRGGAHHVRRQGRQRPCGKAFPQRGSKRACATNVVASHGSWAFPRGKARDPGTLPRRYSFRYAQTRTTPSKSFGNLIKPW